MLASALWVSGALRGQESDSVKVVGLGSVEVVGKWNGHAAARLPEVHETLIMAGKKNEVLRLRASEADLSTNMARQVFAKAPGITVWESEGSGIQTSIAARGLSPNRSWEFNVRQNGYDICAEAFGYPEAYYSPPLEAVERIEVIRGAASLQFGPQFGGLVNYRMKRGASDRVAAVELRQTAGSYGLSNTYASVSGTWRRLSYHVFHQRRSADGWRSNSRYTASASGASVVLAASRRLELGLEYTRMDYVSQQPGGLTDHDFRMDPRSSQRARNWFSAPWNVAAITADLRLSPRTRASLKVFGTLAERNSVGFLRPIQEPDTFQTASGSFAPRQVDRDAYANAGAELRLLQGFTAGRVKGNLSAGVRLYRGRTERRQQGRGTAGSDFDLALTGAFARELALTTENAAAFAESQFKLGERLSIVPGARIELIRSAVQGRIAALPQGELPRDARERRVVLYGIGAEYRVTATAALYANYSKAYRPVLFSELTPAATTDIVDPALRDASGDNADLGYRGSIGRFINFDAGVYRLVYRDRIGTVQRDGGVFRTNIGDSESRGVEAYAEADALGLLAPHGRWGSLRVFASVAFMSTRYTRWTNPALAGDPVRGIEGKRVEYAPERVERYGLTYARKRTSVTALVNRVGDVYADASNSEAPSGAATAGRIDAYQLLDLSGSWLLREGVEVIIGVRNAGDAVYATRRAGGYPGPGLLPGEGRTFYLTLSARL